MHIRALKALTQSRKDMSPPAKQNSCDSEDVNMFTADSHHRHLPLEPSILYPFRHPFLPASWVLQLLRTVQKTHFRATHLGGAVV